MYQEMRRNYYMLEDLRIKYLPFIPRRPLELPHHQLQELVPLDCSTLVTVGLVQFRLRLVRRYDRKEEGY